MFNMKWRIIIARILIIAMAGNPVILAAHGIEQAGVVLVGGQPAALKQSANGTQVIDIAAPGSKGVSHNKFEHFNVPENGLIINNSQGPALSVLGGFTDGNRRLSGGTARLVLAEVIGGNRSNLLGFTEMLGDSAEFILANPNGITCNGCGFINIPRVTFATGIPDLINGELAGFTINGGDVFIDGEGLNAANVSKFDILTRAMAVNAALYADELNIRTGTGYYDITDDRFTSVANSHLTDLPPLFALDASALGAMYTNTISLIGTEAGLGVRSQGLINSVGSLQLTADGKLQLKDTIAAGDLSLRSVNADITTSGTTYGHNVTVLMDGTLHNSGVMAAAENMYISGAGLQQSGSLLAGINAQGEWQSQGEQQIHISAEAVNQGQIISQGQQIFSAQMLHNTSDGRIQADTALLSGEQITNDGILSSNNLLLNVDDINQSGHLQAQRLDINTQQFTQSGGVLYQSGETGQLTISANNLSINGGLVAAEGAAQIGVSGQLQNHADWLFSKEAIINAATIINSGTLQLSAQAELTANILRNSGNMLFSGEQAVSLTLTELLDNQNGLLQFSADATLTALLLNNNAGNIQHLGNGDIALNIAQNLTNRDGRIISNSNMLITAPEFNNEQGVLGANSLTLVAENLNSVSGNIQAEQVHITAQQLDNRKGSIAALNESGESLQLNIATKLDNSQGQVLAKGQQLTIQSQQIINEQGVLLLGGGQGMTLLASEQLNNQQGIIQSAGALNITTPLLNNEQGDIYATDIDFQTVNLQNRAGVIAAQYVQMSGTDFDNRGGTVSALSDSGQNLALNFSQRLDNREQGVIQSAGQVAVLSSQQLLNNQGHILLAGNDGQLQLNVDTLQNASGKIQTNSTLQLTAQTVDNQSGAIVAIDELNITAENLTNHDGQLLAESVRLDSAELDNTRGVIQATADLSLHGRFLNNLSGIIRGGKAVDIQVADSINNQQGQLLAGQNMVLQTRLLENKQGILLGAEQLSIDTVSLQNSDDGVISSAQLALTTSTLRNQQARIEGQQVKLTSSSLDNAGTILATGTGQHALVLQTDKLNNQGHIESHGQDLQLKDVQLHNQGQIYHLGAGVLRLEFIDELNNTAGEIYSAGQLNISGGNINNAAGQLISAQDFILNAADLTNIDGIIQANNSLIASAINVDNTQGVITAANGNLQLLSQTIHNQQGTLYSGGEQGLLQAGHILNDNGKIILSGNGLLNIDTQRLDNLGDGQISAAGQLTINATQLTNSGNIISELLHINGVSVVNHGQLASQRLQLKATDILNDGNILTASADITADILNNSGLIQVISEQQPGQMRLNAARFNNTGSIVTDITDIHFSGQQFDNRQGSIVHLGAGVLNIDVLEQIQNQQGQLITAGAMTLQSGTLLNQDGVIEAGKNIHLQQKSLNNDSGRISAANTLTVSAQTINNTEGQINAAMLDITATRLDNRQGQLLAVGQTENGINLNIAEELNNQQGLIFSAAANNYISVPTLYNENGVIRFDQAGHLQLQQLNNTGGNISAENALVLQAQYLDNQQGELTAGQLNLQADTLDNRSGLLLARQQQGESFTVTVRDTLHNSAGQLLGMGQSAHLDTGVLNNDAGTIALTGSGVLTLNSQTLNNASGQISAAGQLNLSAATLTSDGQIIANDLELQLTELHNSGLILAEQTMQVSANAINNSGQLAAQQLLISAQNAINSGTIQAAADSGESLILNLQQLRNSGSIISNGTDFKLHQVALNNNGGSLLHTGNGILSVETLDTLDNLAGQIVTNGKLQLIAGQLNNQDGLIQIAKAANINVTALNNLDGHILALGEQRLQLLVQQLLDNRDGRIIGGQLQIDTGNLNNQAGQLASINEQGQSLTLHVLGELDNTAGQIAAAGGNALINSAQLINQDGRIHLTGNGELQLQSNLLDNHGNAQISSQGRLTLDTQQLNNSAVVLADEIRLTAEQLNNSGLIQADALHITADTVSNRTGQLLALGDSSLTLVVDGVLDNQQGVIASNGQLVIDAAELDNRQGQLQALSALRITGGRVDNRQGVISAEQASLQLKQLDNTGGGRVVAAEQLTVHSDVLVNDGMLSAGVVDINAGALHNQADGQINGQQVQVGADVMDNAGVLYGEQLQLSGETLTNTGLIQALQQGTLNVVSLLNQQGQIHSQGQLDIVATTVRNQGGLLQGNGLTVQGQTLLNEGGKVLALGEAGLQLTLGGQLENLDGTLYSGGQHSEITAGQLTNSGVISHSGHGALTITAQTTDNRGTLESAGQVTLSGTALDNSGIISAEHIALTTEHITNSGTVSGQSLHVTAEQLTNSGAVTAAQLQLTLTQLDNRGQVVASGESGESLQLNAETVINHGLLASKGEQLRLQVLSLDNRDGELLHLGAGVLSIEVLQSLNNQQGQIYSDGSVALQADVLDNRGGELQGQVVNIGSRVWDNRAGQVLALAGQGNTLTVEIDEQLDNRGGVIYSGGGQARITAHHLLNEQGQLTQSGSGRLTVVAGTIENGAEGVIASNDELWLQSEQLDSAGQLMADKLVISADTLTNRGRIDGTDITIKGIQANNSGIIAATGPLLSDTRHLNNSGTLYSGADMTLKADNLLNSGTIAQSGVGVLSIEVLETLNNQQGRILGEGALQLTAATLNNQQGLIQGDNRVTLTASTLLNQEGNLLALGQQPLTITVQDTLDNHSGTIGADVLVLSAGTLDNRSGLLQASDITVTATDITNQGGRVISDVLHITAGQLSNQDGVIAANDGLRLEVAGVLDNRDGDIVTTAAQAYIGAGNLNNDGGLISQQAGTSLQLDVRDALSNEQGTLHSAGQLSVTANALSSSGVINADAVTIDAVQLHNRGTIQGETVGLSATQLHNDGTILASGQVGESLTLSATAGMINRGHIQSEGQTLVLRDALTNDSGTLVHTGSGMLQLGALSNQLGTVYSGGQLAIDGAVSNQQGLIQALSGLSVQGGIVNNREGVIRHGGDLLLDVVAWDNRGGELSSQGQRADITVAGVLQNDGGVIVSSAQQLTVTAGDIALGSGVLAGHGQVDVTAEALSVGKDGQLSAGQTLAITTQTLTNQGVLSAQQLNIDSTVVDNRAGVIEAASQLQVTSDYLNNAAGVLLSQGGATIAVNGQRDGVALDNRGGQIIASGALVLNTPYAIENSAGRIVTEQQLTVTGSALDNTSGQLIAGRGLTVGLSGVLSNHDGVVYSGEGDVSIEAQQLHNTGEAVLLQQGAGQMQLTVGRLVNEGEIGAGTVLAITADQLNNSGIIQATAVDLTTTKLSNSGRLLAEQLLVSGQQINNTGGIIAALSASGTVHITADTLHNQQGVIQGQSLILNTVLNNRQGEVLSLGSGSLNIKALADNQQGKILSQGSLQLKGSVNNTQGVLQALTDLNINGSSVNNADGAIHAGGQLEIHGSSLNNQGGKITAAGDRYQLNITDKLDNSADGVLAFAGNMSVTAGTIDNRSGNIYQQGNGSLLLTADNGFDNQQGVIVSNAGLTINTADLNNNGGQIAAKATASINAGVLTNRNGRIESGDVLNLLGMTQLDNRDGHLSARNITAELSGALNNIKGTLFAAETLSINAGSIDNSNGILAANNNAIITTTGTLNNNAGLLQAGKHLNISAANINNSAGTIQGSTVELNSLQRLDNSNGTIHGQTVALNAASLNNSGGVLLATSAADNALLLTGLRSLNNDQGTVASHGRNLNLSLTELSNDNGRLLHLGDGTFTLSVAETLNNSGTIASNANLTLNTDTLINTGTVQAQQQLLLNGGLTNQADAVLAANNMVINAVGKTIDNAGTLSASNNLNLQANNITNRHLLFSGNRTTAQAGTIANSGVWSANHLEATGFSQLQNSGRLESNTAVYSGNLLQNLVGGILVNAGSASNGLQLNVTALNNSGTVYNNARDMAFGGSLTNSGSVIHAGSGTLTLGSAGSINNADGSISSAGTAVIQNSILGAGTVYAEQGMQLSSTGTFTNQSQLYTKGNMQVDSALHNQGSLLSDGTLRINSSGNVTNSGAIQGQNLTLTAALLNNNGGSITSIGNGNASIVTSSLNNSNGIIQSTNRDLTISTSGGDINNSNGQIRHSGGGTLLLDSAGNINQQSGSVLTVGKLIATAQGDINNSYGVMSADAYQLSAKGTFTNSNGQIAGSGNTASSINATILNNRDGYIAANGSGLTLTAVSGLNNDNGSILLAGNGLLNIAAGSLSNNSSSSRIISNGGIELNAGSLLNNSGMLSAAGLLSVNAGAIGNSGILASRGGQLTIDSTGTLTNSGTVSGATGVKADVKGLNNTSGMLQSDGRVDIIADSLTVGQMYATDLQLNSQQAITVQSGEQLSAKGNLAMTSGGNISNSGSITASGALTLGGSELSNSANGVIRAGTNATLGFTALNNSGIISGNNNLILNVGNTTNSGTLAGANQLDINGNIINSNLLFAGNLLTIDGNVSNTSSIYSNGDAIISGNTITNTGGTIAAARDMSISGKITNTYTGDFQYIDGEVRESKKTISSQDHSSSDQERYWDNEVEYRTTKVYEATLIGSEGLIVSGKNLYLNGEVKNLYSSILSGGNIVLSGLGLTTDSASNQEVTTIKTVIEYWYDDCGWVFTMDCKGPVISDSQVIESRTEQAFTGNSYGKVVAKGNITGNVTGKVEQNSLSPITASGNVINTTANGSSGSASRGGAASSASGSNVAVNSNSGSAQQMGTENRSAQGVTAGSGDNVTVGWRDNNGGGASSGSGSVNIGLVSDAQGRQVDTLDNAQIEAANNQQLQGQQQQVVQATDATVKSQQQVQQGSQVSNEQLLAQQFNGTGAGNGAVDSLSGSTVKPVQGNIAHNVTRQQGSRSDYQPVDHQAPEEVQQQLVSAPQRENDTALQGQRQQVVQTTDATVKSQQQVQQGSQVSNEQLLAQQFNDAGKGNRPVDSLSGTTITPVQGNAVLEVSRQQGSRSDYQPVDHQAPEESQQQANIGALHLSQNALLANEQISGPQQQGVSIDPATGLVNDPRLKQLPDGGITDGNWHTSLPVSGDTGTPFLNQGVSAEQAQVNAGQLLQGQLAIQSANVQGGTQQVAVNDPARQSATGMQGNITAQGLGFIAPDMAGRFAVNGQTPQTAVPDPLQGGGQISNGNTASSGQNPDLTIKNMVERQQDTAVQQQNAGLTTNTAPVIAGQQAGQHVFLTDEQMRVLTEDLGFDADAINKGQQTLYASVSQADLLPNGVTLKAGGMIDITADAGFSIDTGIGAGEGLILRSENGLDMGNLGFFDSENLLGLQLGGDFTNNQNLQSNTLWLDIGGNFTNTGSVTGNDVLSITTGNDLINQNLLSGGHVQLNAGGDIINRTEYTQYTVQNGGNSFSYTTVGNTPQILSSDSLSMTAGNNIDLQGSRFSSAGDISLNAGNDVLLGAVEKVSGHEKYFKGGYDIELHRTYDVVSFDAGGNLSISAGNNLVSEGAQFSAGGIAALNAGNDMELLAVVESHYDADKTTRKKTFSKKVTETVSLHEEVQGTTITAGNILLNATVDENGNVVKQSGGNVTAVGATLNADNNIIVFGQDITFTAGQYQDYEYSHTSKSSFGGLKSKSREELAQDALLSGSSVSAGGNLVMRADNDINVLASGLSGENIVLNAFNNVLIAAGEESRIRESRSKSGGFLSGGSLFSSVEQMNATAKITANSASLNASGNIVIDAGSATVIGSSIDAGGKLAVKTDIGGIQVLAAKETEQNYSYRKELNVGLGDVLKAFSDPVGLVKDTYTSAKDSGRLSMTIANADYLEAENRSSITQHKGSDITANNGVSFDAAGNINIEGSYINADKDGDKTGALTLIAGGNVRVADVTDTFSQSSKTTSGSAQVNAMVTHQAAEMAHAAIAVKDATEQLEDTRRNYKAWERQQDELKGQLATLEGELAQGKPGVTQADIDDLRAQIDILATDEAWHVANIAVATANLVTATTNLAQQSLTSSASTTTWGFNAGLELNVNATVTETDVIESRSVGSYLSGAGIAIKTGEEGTLEIAGSGINSTKGMTVDVGNLVMKAGESTYNSQTQSKQGNINISQTVWGAAAGGPAISGSLSLSEQRDHSTTYNNAILTAAGQMVMDVKGDASLIGATVNATEGLLGNIGGNLTLQSVQDVSYGSDKGVGIRGGMSFDGVYTNEDGANADTTKITKTTGLGQTGEAKTGNAGISLNNGRYYNKDTVLSSITSGGALDMTVGGNTGIVGALIAAIDEKGVDTGKLNLKTGSLSFADLTNTYYNNSNSISLNTNVLLGDNKTAQDKGVTNQPQDSKGEDQPSGTTNLGLHQESSYGKSKTLATVGNGIITVGGEETEPEGLNRDVDAVDKELYSIERTKGNMDVTVQNKTLEQLADAFGISLDKQAELIEAIGVKLDSGLQEQLGQSGAQAVSGIMNQFGMTEEEVNDFLLANPKLVDVMTAVQAVQMQLDNPEGFSRELLVAQMAMVAANASQVVNNNLNDQYGFDENYAVKGAKIPLSPVQAAGVVIGQAQRYLEELRQTDPQAAEIVSFTISFVTGGPVKAFTGHVANKGLETYAGEFLAEAEDRASSYIGYLIAGNYEAVEDFDEDADLYDGFNRSVKDAGTFVLNNVGGIGTGKKGGSDSTAVNSSNSKANGVSTSNSGGSHNNQVVNHESNSSVSIQATIEPKIAQQMSKRGWSRESIESTIQNPHKTVTTKDTRFDPVSGTRLNDPATAYVARDGSYVVRNDRTGAIVQVSNKNDPTWKAPWD